MPSANNQFLNQPYCSQILADKREELLQTEFQEKKKEWNKYSKMSSIFCTNEFYLHRDEVPLHESMQLHVKLPLEQLA